MNDQDLKLKLLDLSGGDVDKAKAMMAWITVAPSVTKPDPAPTVEGIVLTDAEVLAADPDALQALAMQRLAVKQNSPVIAPVLVLPSTEKTGIIDEVSGG